MNTLLVTMLAVSSGSLVLQGSALTHLLRQRAACTAERLAGRGMVRSAATRTGLACVYAASAAAALGGARIPGGGVLGPEALVILIAAQSAWLCNAAMDVRVRHRLRQEVPQLTAAQASPGGGVSGVHTEHEDMPWTVDVAGHPPRTDSPEYVKTRALMNRLARTIRGMFYGQPPFQDHHGGALWVKDAAGWFLIRNFAGIVWSSQFCLNGEVKVLTADLRWVPIKTVQVNDSLLGFDEESTTGLWRRWRPAEVLATQTIERPCYDLVFDDGTKIRASAEHQWLVGRGGENGHHGNSAWVETQNLRVAANWTDAEDAGLRELYTADVPCTEIASILGRSVNAIASRATRLGIKKANRHRRGGYTVPDVQSQRHLQFPRNDTVASKILRLADVWEEDHSRGGGYLAAAFDGEGWLTQTEDEERGRGFGTSVRLGFAQRSNVMLEEVEKLLKERGYDYSLRCGTDNCNRLLIRSRADIMRLLGSVRPHRLLTSFQPSILGTMQRIASATLIEKRFVGMQPVVAMSTSTGTFVAEGLASHNCADPARVDLLRVNAQRVYAAFPDAVEELGIRDLLDTPITDATGVARWTDSICNASVPLPADLHTGVPHGSHGGGVHHFPAPIVEIDTYRRADFQLWVVDSEGQPAAVAPVAPRGSGDGRTHVLFATHGSRLHAEHQQHAAAGTAHVLEADHPLSKQAFAQQADSEETSP